MEGQKWWKRQNSFTAVKFAIAFLLRSRWLYPVFGGGANGCAPFDQVNIVVIAVRCRAVHLAVPPPKKKPYPGRCVRFQDFFITPRRYYPTCRRIKEQKTIQKWKKTAESVAFYAPLSLSPRHLGLSHGDVSPSKALLPYHEAKVVPLAYIGSILGCPGPSKNVTRSYQKFTF